MARGKTVTPPRIVEISAARRPPSPWGYNIKVTTRTNVQAVWTAVWKTTDLAAKIYADYLKGFMQENVAPGRGPGPHPHRVEHTDTGWAAKSIVVRQVRKNANMGGDKGPLWYAGAFSDMAKPRPALAKKYARSTPPHQYLFYLEFGWVQHGSGRRYRYPWAEPAKKKAAKQRIGRVTGVSGLYITGSGVR